jgi:hypothetical protein
VLSVIYFFLSVALMAPHWSFPVQKFWQNVPYSQQATVVGKYGNTTS